MWTREEAVSYAKKELDSRNCPRSGGMWVDGDGYIHFRTHRSAKSRRFHRYITIIRTGNQLTGLEVHHMDEDKLNNTDENLEILTFEQHRAKHSSKAVRDDDKRFLWRETRKGSGNPNYGNHNRRKNRTPVDKDQLRDAINKHRRPSLVQRCMKISEKIYTNRCKEYGFEYRCLDDGLIPQIP